MTSVGCRHTIEELQELVETAKQAVPGVDAAIAAAIDRKLNPVSHSACRLVARPALALHACCGVHQAAFWSGSMCTACTR